jgi:peptide/nickel transport system substrate-binding protein
MKLLIVLMMAILSVSVVAKSIPVRVAISSSPSNLDPFFATDSNSQNINRLVHISLTDFNSKMKFECKLCSSYTEKVIGGKHHIRFKLKKNIKFWDGTSVTAEDVKRTHYYFTEDKTLKSIFRFAFRKIKKVIVHGRYDVELVYAKFSLENLSNLCLFKIVKMKPINSDGVLTRKPELEDIIGAGNYKYKSITSLSVDLESVVPNGRIPLSFKVVKDETTLALKLINKEVDLSIANISPRKYQWLKKQNKLKFWEIPSTNYKYIGINHKKNHLKDIRIRKALSLLIPRKELAEYKLKGTILPATGMFSPAFKGMYQEREFEKYNPELAAKLISEVGYKKNSEGKWYKDGKSLSIDWKVPSNKATLEMVSTIKSYFEKVGIEVKLTIQEWGTFMRSFKNGRYDIVLGKWVGFTGPEMLEFTFHSSRVPPKGGNRGYFINTAFDKYIDKATSEINENKRNSLYKKAHNIAFDDYAYLNLWHPNIIWISRKCISGVALQPNGSFSALRSLVNNCK